MGQMEDYAKAVTAYGLGPMPERQLRLIDVDKVKQAFAASTLCQNKFFKPGTEVDPHMLCAISAMVVYAGMTPELWGTLVTDAETLETFAKPILWKQYGIPGGLFSQIIWVFDHAGNEWEGVIKLIEMFEGCNMVALHVEALCEDRLRFPLPITATSLLEQVTQVKKEYLLQKKSQMMQLYSSPSKNFLADFASDMDKVIEKKFIDFDWDKEVESFLSKKKDLSFLVAPL